MDNALEPQDLLEPGNNGTFLRDFACEAGATASMLLLELLGYDKCFRQSYVTHPIYGNGWFYATEEKIQRRTGIKRRQQEADIQTLIEYKFIEMKVFGLPASRHFRINKKAVREFFGLKEELPEWRKRQSSNTVLNNHDEYDQKNILERTKRQTRTDDNPNKIVQKSKLGLINNTHELEYELEEEIHAPQKWDACSPAFSQTVNIPSKEKIPKTHPHKNVTVTVEEHSKLVDKFGIELVVEGYADLSEWKESASPGVVAKHKSDYRRLRKWVIPNLQEEKMKGDRVKQQNIAPHRRGSKLVTQGDLEDPSNFKIKRF